MSSLMPYFFNYDVPWPKLLLDQHFGVTLTPEDVGKAAVSPIFPHVRPWFPTEVGSSIKLEKDKWQISVDVQHFAPEEITVKTTEGFVVIEGKHEEKKDAHGFVSRQFVRRFKLPDDCDLDGVESRLSSDGVLSVVAPKKAEKVAGERNVPIQHTGPVKKAVKDDLKQEVKEK